MRNKAVFTLLLTITTIGAFLRFYNLNWDGPYFFHPDERNIARAVTNLNFSKGDFDPNFFAYGSFPIYIVRGIIEIANATDVAIFGIDDPFSQAILISRFLSALLSTLLIPLVFFVTLHVLKFRKPKLEIRYWAMAAAVLTTFAPGLIQFAHFGTFEIFLTFEYLLALYYTLKVASRGTRRDYLGLSIILGLAVATKIVSLVILPILLLAHWLRVRKENPRGFSLGSLLTRQLLLAASSTALTFMIFFIPSLVDQPSDFLLLVPSLTSSRPTLNHLDIQGFLGAMDYEGPVATGKLPVFYTQQFNETIPVVYQLTRVFPYILGLPLTIVSVLAVFWFGFNILRKTLRSVIPANARIHAFTSNWIPGQARNDKIVLILIMPFLYLIPHFAFFVKWTRYMIPVLPLLVILSITFLYRLYNRTSQSWTSIVILITTAVTVLQGLNFFSIYLQPDPRIKAAKWGGNNFSQETKILSEVYDMGIVPWNSQLPAENITLFNFYNLDDGYREEAELRELNQLVQDSDVIVLPSSRVYATRFRLCEEFTKECRFYSQVFNGTLGFEKVAEFRRKPVVQLPFVYHPFTIDRRRTSSVYLFSDETFTIFDNPAVVVFEKSGNQ